MMTPGAETAPVSSAATFLFADIAGFTALNEAHGDEGSATLSAHFSIAIKAELPSCDGAHVKSIGDALMLRIPDPGAAIALGLRIAGDLMRDHGAPAVRVGLHHGPAIERDGDYFGATVNLAARVSAAAVGGEVLLTAHAASLAPAPPPRRAPAGVASGPRGRPARRTTREPVELVAAVRIGEATEAQLAV